MAEEEQAQEKTEEPSSKRLKESRDKGQVARSKYFNATVILFTSVGFLTFGKQLSANLLTMMRQSFEFDTQVILTSAFSFERLFFLARYGIIAVIPILVVIFLLSIGTPLLMGGWVFSTDQLKPKMSRLNPLKGLARMVSLKGFVEMGKAFLKFILVAGASILVLKSH